MEKDIVKKLKVSDLVDGDFDNYRTTDEDSFLGTLKVAYPL